MLFGRISKLWDIGCVVLAWLPYVRNHTFKSWVVYKLFPVFRESLQGCVMLGVDLFVGQFSVYVPDGCSDRIIFNSFKTQFKHF